MRAYALSDKSTLGHGLKMWYFPWYSPCSTPNICRMSFQTTGSWGPPGAGQGALVVPMRHGLPMRCAFSTSRATAWLHAEDLGMVFTIGFTMVYQWLEGNFFTTEDTEVMFVSWPVASCPLIVHIFQVDCHSSRIQSGCHWLAGQLSMSLRFQAMAIDEYEKWTSELLRMPSP